MLALIIKIMFKIIKPILFIFLIFISTQVVSASTVFSDVPSNHPNFDAINYLQENGIVQGYEDNTFKPEKLVNRAEALKIILLGSNILVPEIQNQEIFPDVLHGSWYAKYVTKAKNLRIVNGDSNTGMFRPGDTINLAEAMKILLETNNINTSTPNSNPYLDVPSNAWFAKYFAYAESINLLDQNSNQNVNPSLPVNRGLLAELMYRLILKPNGYAEGKASYYGDAFHGRTTASGEVFDASGFTAAHKTYAFGTWLRVTNLDNNKFVYVKVTDRGPYVEGRILDLSQAAFEAISPLSRGVINISVIPENPPTNNPNLNTDSTTPINAKCPELNDVSLVSKTKYDNITLDNEFPNTFIKGEVLTISGSTTSNNDFVSAFLVDNNNNQVSFTENVSNKKFKINVYLANEGSYKLGIIPGESGSSAVEQINVLPSNCITENQGNSLPSPSNFSIDIENGNSVLSWDKDNYNVFKLIFTQNNKSKTYYFYNDYELIPNYRDFENFNKGNVNVSIQGANLSNNYISESNSVTWSNSANISFDAKMHYEYIIDKDQIDLLFSPKYITKGSNFKISIDPKTTINAEGAIVLPDGTVSKINLNGDGVNPITNSNGLDVFDSSTSEINLSYKPTSDDLYFAEINNSDGLATLNIPLYPKGSYPLIPNLVELSERISTNLGSDLNSLKNQFLYLVNKDRQEQGLNKLNLDSSINSLAQFRSDDMVNNNYFSHYDKNGNSANDIRKNYAISQVIAENIAKDTTLELAEYGLMRSAIHRANILSAEWTRMGVGITEDPSGGYIFVQLFSADPIDMENLSLLRKNILSDINDVKNINYSLQNNLNTIAQSWSENMVLDDYFDFISPSGDSLIQNIRNSRVNASLGTYIVGNTNFEDAKKQIVENSQILESNWKNLGLGIDIDEFGVIKITLIYTE